MEYRIEHDTLGEVKVPADHMWGAQTQRSSENFKIGARMPEEIIHAFAVLKKCTALANLAEGKLSEEKQQLIINHHMFDILMIVFHRRVVTRTLQTISSPMHVGPILQPSCRDTASTMRNPTVSVPYSVANGVF